MFIEGPSPYDLADVKTPIHIVDLKKMGPSEKEDYRENVIDRIGSSEDLIFVNDETKS